MWSTTARTGAAAHASNARRPTSLFAIASGPRGALFWLRFILDRFGFQRLPTRRSPGDGGLAGRGQRLTKSSRPDSFSTFIPAGLGEAGQVVGDVQPGDLFLGEDMAAGRAVLGVIQAADGDMDLAGVALALVAQGRAAITAEPPRDALRGLVAERRSLDEPVILAPESRPGHDHRSRGPAAALAVAMGDPEGLADAAVAHRAAQAAALDGSLLPAHGASLSSHHTGVWSEGFSRWPLGVLSMSQAVSRSAAWGDSRRWSMRNPSSRGQRPF